MLNKAARAIALVRMGQPIERFGYQKNLAEVHKQTLGHLKAQWKRKTSREKGVMRKRLAAISAQVASKIKQGKEKE